MTTTLAVQTSPAPIPFTRPSTGTREQAYIAEALRGGKLSGDGPFTLRCQKLLQDRYGFPRTLLTTSCTDALELAALLLGVGPGDEVIVPSYTFVSTANAFALRGARIVFADSRPDHPNLDADAVEALVTPRTKAIVAVHYAGAGCDMDKLLAIGERHGLKIVEDAAQAIDATWKGRPLGSIGAFGAFSFHETKNISCGEGGAIVINDKSAEGRAEIMREKGTNRSAFFRGEVNKYGWVDLGSSFLPSDILAAYLLGQLESIDDIQRRRLALWNRYHENLEPLMASLGLQPQIVPAGASNNAHMYYVLFESLASRTRVHEAMREAKVGASFHYLSLHASPYFAPLHDGRALPHADRYSDCLLRLPLFGDMTAEQVDRTCEVLVDAIRS